MWHPVDRRQAWGSSARKTPVRDPQAQGSRRPSKQVTPRADSLLAEGREQVLAAIAVAPDTGRKHGLFYCFLFCFPSPH